MVTRKYIKDYKLSESVTERGGIRTEAVYVGKHFEFADEAGAKKCARTLLWGGCGAWLLFLGALLPRTGASKLMWVILPFAFSALPLGYMTGSAILLWRRQPRGAAHTLGGGKALQAAACVRVWLMLLAGVSALGWALLPWPRRRA